MKIEKIVIGEEEIKVRKGHREQNKKWFERVESPKTEYKRQKSQGRWWEDEEQEEED